MKKHEALTISIGVLGAVDTFVTATIIPVPVFVTFIAWASFFIVGGGRRGLVQSLASNLTGIAIATLSLLAISGGPPGPITAAVLVGVGSAAMVQASKLPILSATPAIVWGFASLVGTTVATGVPITSPTLTHPTLIAALAMIVGALFGYASEVWGNALEAQPKPAPLGAVPPAS